MMEEDYASLRRVHWWTAWVVVGFLCLLGDVGPFLWAVGVVVLGVRILMDPEVQ